MASEGRRRWYARKEGRDVISIVLAGGEGRRLYPLTKDRCKPAVPFGGRYRIVDFVLSNLVNSGIYRNILLTQFKSQSLTRHVERAWQLSALAGHFIEPVPAQMRRGPHWYKGNADAIFQNLDILAPELGDIICVFGADHIYRMDLNQMIGFHVESGAECTIAAIPAPLKDATQYGVMAVGDKGKIVRFDEKPAEPAPMPGDPSKALVSMGNYVFSRKALVDAVVADAEADSAHDLGRNIMPAFVNSGTAYAYNFGENRVAGAIEGGEPYWRDVGT
ncbi:MAG: glucose-1-phosphate adenylyltransferase, partial [Candidatus Methylomirabilis sp.]|nr:glucose-1-phosphate adenylyltransferase [Deltaproteobacteria bacterium]